jgi:hypothetical protein
MTASEIEIAEQALKGAREKIEGEDLWVGGVRIKAVHRGNVMVIFPPGVREIVRRYLRGW